MNISPQTMIISSTDHNATFESQDQAALTMNGLLSDLGLAFKQTMGKYNGQTNDSFVVVVNNQDEIDAIKAIAFNRFGQEAVLVQDSNRQCTLEFSNGTFKPTGKLVPVASCEGLENYTVMNNSFYTTI